MDIEDQGAGTESTDQQLEAAVQTLKQLPQAEVAAKIGISERRYRDIERGRSAPRRKTRDAIVQLAAGTQGWQSTSNSSTSSPDLEAFSSLAQDLRRIPWPSVGVGQPVSGWVVLCIFGVIVIAIILIG